MGDDSYKTAISPSALEVIKGFRVTRAADGVSRVLGVVQSMAPESISIVLLSPLP